MPHPIHHPTHFAAARKTRCPRVLLLGLVLGLTPLSAGVLWRIGHEDGSNAEFTGSSNPVTYTIPSDWATRTDWPGWKGGTAGGVPGEWWDSAISYSLASVPPGGAEFVFKTLDASGMVPEVGVFSNGLLAGILQVVGAETPNQGNGRMFGNTYRLYIPPEMLQAGTNTLRLEKLSPTYNRGAWTKGYLNIEWDYFRLDGLAVVPPEPIHSRKVYLGSVYGSQGFKVDATRVETEWKLWEWLGMAYSGNPIRAQFWSNLPSGQPEKTAYLELCRDYNMTVVLNRLTDKDSAANESAFIDASGNLTSAKSSILDDAFANWGNLVQYYEISNEPCMSITHGSFAVNKAIARYLWDNAPAHWRVTAPGYTYGGGWGLPVDWDAVDANRIELEAWCHAGGGHSYGNSYYKQDGILSQTVDTFGSGSPKVVANGFPVEVVLTECGTHHTSHKDFTNIGMGDQSTGRLRAAMYDKNLRAHIGYADRILNFAMWDRDPPFRLLDGDRGDPTTWSEHVFPLNSEFANPEVQNKLQVFRRLAAAYASHGKPLTWTYRNPGALQDALVYVRAVDTSTLPPLPGSGATSNKVILSFVNFHHSQTHTLQTTITLPGSGTWEGVRFDSSPSYTQARSEVALSAGPAVDIDVTLGPLETVQYILTPPGGGAGPGNGLAAAADTYLQRYDGTPNGSEGELLVKAQSGIATTERLSLIRFDLGGMTLPVSNASLELDAVSIGGAFTFRLLGVMETNADENFDQATLDWNTSALADASDDGFINSETLLLEEFTLTGAETVVTVASPALANFLNADNDGTVTLLLQRLTEDAAVSRFASNEHATLAGPRLLTGGSGGTGLLGDTYLRRFDGTANGAEGELLVKAETGADSTDRLALLRFDVAGSTGGIGSAALELSAVDVGGDFDFRLLGVKEDNPDETFDEATLDWNTSALSDGSGDGYDNTGTVILGDFALLSSDTAIALTSQALTDFVNADTDGTVTLMLQRLTENGAVSRFASKESTSLPPPALALTPLGARRIGDTFLRRLETTPQGTGAEILVKAVSGTADTERLGLVRFDVGGLTLPVGTASLDLSIVSLGGNFDFRLLGVKESNADETFDESTLHWGNSALADGSDDGFINSETTPLGDFSLLSSDTDVSLTSQALVDFINADTDGTVTLMIQRLDESGTVSYFAAGEHGTLPGPALSVAP